MNKSAMSLLLGLRLALVFAVVLVSAGAILSSAFAGSLQERDDIVTSSQPIPGGAVDIRSVNLGQRDAAEILVKFRPGTDAMAMGEVHRRYGGRVVSSIPQVEVQIVEIQGDRLADSLASYASDPLVDYVERNALVQSAGLTEPGFPNDAYFDRQWNMEKIQAPQAWAIGRGSPDVVIAILDSGIDQNHPDLRSKVVASRNFTTSDTAEGVLSHGTHVAGTAAASTNNSIGVSGVGYDCSLMNVKVIDDTLGGCYSWLIQGIIWATDNGADVINMNLIAGVASATLENAVNYAWQRGVVLVAPAGNAGSSTPTYPGSYANCIAVAATDLSDSRCSWSSYGTWVDVSAPGVGIYSTLCGGYYGTRGGTCAATPHVAGLAGLLCNIVVDGNGNGRANDEVRDIIEGTCDDIGDSTVGHGRINAYRALLAATGSPGDVSEGSISSTVADAITGKPVEGARVSDSTRSAITGSDGSCTITGIPEGSYTVTVSADGYEDISQSAVAVIAGATSTIDFSLTSLSPTADFWVSSRQGSEPLRLDFEDKSHSDTGIVSWLWDFGDGEASTERNPVHTYVQNGFYTVSLAVTEADGDWSTISSEGYIEVLDTKPDADFSTRWLGGESLLTLVLDDRSTSYDGIVSWQWSFGDGIGSTAKNPVHEYIEAGQYTIVLRVIEDDGSVDVASQVVEVGGTPGITMTAISAGNPVEGCRVYAYTAQGAYAGQIAYTDASGQAFFGLPEGAYKFRVCYEGGFQWSQVVVCPGSAVVDIPAETVVTVTVAGEPLQDWRVYACTAEGAYAGQIAYTDASGQAFFSLPEGSYRFKVYYDGVYWWCEAVYAQGRVDLIIP